MKKIGFILNPFAGIGGKVGLKGSDGEKIQERALQLGANKESGEKALVALRMLEPFKDEIQCYTCSGELGEDVCKKAGLRVTVIGESKKQRTVPQDTIQAAIAFAEVGVELVVFVGGDGTARNIMDAIGTKTISIGIPAGCKIHSGVYALNPRAAGNILVRFVQGKIRDMRLAEVMDINEELFRQGIVEAKLYGYLKILDDRNLVQNLKSGRGKSEAASTEQLSSYVAENMEDDTLYIVGTGSTTAAVMKQCGLQNTLLGVDLVYQKKILASDCTEKQLLEMIEGFPKKKIIVTVIGGQGYVFGRGNQQLSAEVIRCIGKENIIIVATRNKMMELFGNKLHIDTGNEEVNRYLCGYYKVIVGYEDMMMMPMSD